MSQTRGEYYVPHGTHWPMLLTISLIVLVTGVAQIFNQTGSGEVQSWIGLAATLGVIFMWFRDVVNENETGKFTFWEDMTFRWGMGWFIFSEVMFFAAFFGALFYGRVLSLDWLGGNGAGEVTHQLLWPAFDYVWPSNGPGALGGEFEVMGAGGLPLYNTLILLTSGATVTYAHHALRANNRTGLIVGLFLTVALGFLFVYLQAHEYAHAYEHMNLTLHSGLYGSTFFMLTGFHGMHVTLGAIMLTIMLFRSMKGHFTPERHFAFEAAAWYWHFVDVVWLGLYLFVYWL